MIKNRSKILILFSCFLVINIFFASSKLKNNSIKNNYKPFGIIVSGPSGIGKTTIVKEFIKKHKNVLVSVSATTRQPRKGEIDGKDYYFIDKNSFKKMITNNEFLEYAEYTDNYYGSPKNNYVNALQNNNDIIFVLSTDGYMNLKKQKDLDIISIFITTENIDMLKQRLINRKTENEEQINKRLGKIKYEMSFAKNYDYIITNDTSIDATVKKMEDIYFKEQKKRK